MSDDLIIKGGMTVGGGLLGSLLTWLGIRDRITRLEQESVNKDVCMQCQSKSSIQIVNLSNDITEIKGSQNVIFSKVNTILHNQAVYMAKIMKE